VVKRGDSRRKGIRKEGVTRARDVENVAEEREEKEGRGNFFNSRIMLNV
jgi:hypothetical protein